MDMIIIVMQNIPFLKVRGCGESSLEGRQNVSDAFHVVIRHHPLPLRTAALLMLLRVSQGADTREGEEGLQATVGAQHDIRVQPVAHHQAAARLHAKLGSHAVEHVVAGFAYGVGLALSRRLHSLQQASRTWEHGQMDILFTNGHLGQLKCN